MITSHSAAILRVSELTRLLFTRRNPLTSYSRAALKKYVKANNKVTTNDTMFDSLFNRALRSGVEKGVFAQPKGMWRDLNLHALPCLTFIPGASGGTKLAKKEHKPAAAKPKTAVKPKTEKKPVVKKATTTKKTTAKPAAAPKKKTAAPKKEAKPKVAKKAAPKPKKAAAPKAVSTSTSLSRRI